MEYVCYKMKYKVCVYIGNKVKVDIKGCRICFKQGPYYTQDTNAK